MLPIVFTSNFPLKSEQDVIEMRRSIQKTGVEHPANAPRAPVSTIAVCVKAVMRNAGPL
jgi:hypothetical protein